MRAFNACWGWRWRRSYIAARRQRPMPAYFFGGLLPLPPPDGLPVVLGQLGLGG